ncbi:MAG: hypothetical protein ACT6FD_05550 [Methanosarcinaceae archaeon]
MPQSIFKDRSECGSSLLMIADEIQAYLDAMASKSRSAYLLTRIIRRVLTITYSHS